jgi:oligoribonuclease NrnB/cAMP/cGMP phosphodiesterase (DHH superfamily)
LHWNDVLDIQSDCILSAQHAVGPSQYSVIDHHLTTTPKRHTNRSDVKVMVDYLDVTTVADNFTSVESKMGHYDDVFIDLSELPS